jgi:methionyl-tRNA formyltransferase
MVSDGPAAGSLRIVYFGTPQFAVPTLERLLASRHVVSGVVTQPDRPRGRGQRLTPGAVKVVAMTHQLPVFQPERVRDPEVLDTIRGWQPDLGVVAAYGQLLPDALLRLPRLGMINVHASLLPKYRGAAPIQRAVMDGQHETGVTIMRVVKALDAGGMLDAVRRPIGAEETSTDVEADLARLGAALLADVVDRLAHAPVREEAQDERQVTYARRLTKAEGLIDWNLPAASIHDRVRGLYPWPHAYTYLKGERLILLRTSVDDEPAGASAATGVVTRTDAHGIHVTTGAAGQLTIRELQVEGRRPITAREFLIGHPLPSGTTFDSSGE